MNAWTNFSASETLHMFRSLEMFLRWKNAVKSRKYRSTASFSSTRQTLQELDVLFPVKIWRNLFMALSPAGWVIVMVSSQRRPLESCSSSRTSEHITPVLRSLHWLPVTFRINFKVLLLVYKSLNGLGPKYIADMLTEYKANRPLRSVGSSQLEIPRVHTKQGESAFKTLAIFKPRLKTRLFSCAFVKWALCYVPTDCTVFYVF